MSEQLIEEIDWEGNTVAIHPKSRLKDKMFPHKASLVIPRTQGNKFILSKRAKDQFPFPDTWVCAIGGKVDYGDTYLKAANREAWEEARLDTELEYVAELKHDDDKYQAIFRIFTTKEPIDMERLVPDPKEIQYFKAFTLKEILAKIRSDPESFAPTFRTTLIAFAENINK